MPEELLLGPAADMGVLIRATQALSVVWKEQPPWKIKLLNGLSHKSIERPHEKERENNMEKEIQIQREELDIIAPDFESQRTTTSEEFEQAEGEEVVSLRGENSKQFDLGENRYQAVVYPEPVHYRKAGKWEEIDNNLVEDETDGRRVLRNKANSMLCELAVETDNGPLVVLKHRKHVLSWSFEQHVNPVQAEVLSGETLKRERLLKLAKGNQGSQQRSADAYSDEELRSQETPEARRSDTTGKTSQVLYKGILPGVTVRYTLSGDQLKEDIVCADRDALAGVSLKLPGSYQYAVNNDQSISVRDDLGMERFFFDTPVVYDAAGMTVIGKAVLEQCTDYTRLNYEIDDDFLAVCKYPVTIDPVTKPRPTKDIDWATLTSGGAKSVRPSAPKVIRSSSGETIMVMKLNKLAQIKSSDTVISAKLKLAVTNASKTGGKYMGVYGITKDWAVGSFVKADFFDASNRLINVTELQDYAALGKSTATLDLTNMYRSWYRVEEVAGVKQMLNRGFLVRMESSAGTASLGSPSSSLSKRPQFIVNYISHAGLESWWTYESQSAGRAGTANVDLFNGNVVLAHQDTAMTGNRMPVSISHYYNSCQSAEASADRETTDDSKADFNTLYRCGWGWKHSGLQYIYETKVDALYYYVWVDGDGTEHWFKRDKNKKNRTNREELYDAEGMGLKLTKVAAKGAVSEKIEIEDSSHTVSTFRRRLTAKRKGTWRNWWLTSVRDSMRTSDNKLTNIVNYSYKMPDAKDQDDSENMYALEGQLESITDPAGRVTRFYYYEDGDFADTQYEGNENAPGMGLLKEIQAPNGLDEPLSTFFLYDADQRLTAVMYEDLFMELPKPGGLPEEKELLQLALDGDIAKHTRYVYAEGTNLLQTVANYDDTRVALQYEQLVPNTDFFDIAEGDDSTDLETGDEEQGTSAEVTVGMSENMLRATSMETIITDVNGTVLARGAKQMFNYLNSATEVTNVESVSAGATAGKKIIYQFNDKGNVISTRDELGYAQFVKYESGQENAPSAVSTTQRAVINRIRRPVLLKDSSNIGAEWTRTVQNEETNPKTNPGNICGFDNKTNRCLSSASMKMVRKKTGDIKFSQTVDLEQGKKWTLSAYVKANAIVPNVQDGDGGKVFVPGDGAYMRAYLEGASPDSGYKSEAITGSTADAFGDGMAADGWERLRLSFSTPAGTGKSRMVVEFVLGGASGTVYFAAPQLEEGLVANPVNLLTNGDFFLTQNEPIVKKRSSDPTPTGHINRVWPSYWSAGKDVSKEKLNTSGSKVVTASDKRIGVFDPTVRPSDSGTPGYNPYDLPGNMYDPFLSVFTGNYLQLRSGMQNASKDNWFTQTLVMSGKEKDVYYAGGWASAKAMPGSTGDVRALQFTIQFCCKDKNGKSKWYTGKGGKHNFNSEWVGWQMQAGAAIAPKDYSQVRIVLIAKGQPLYAKFTNFYLVREEFGESFQYDGKKNVVSTTERSGQQAGMEYDTFGNLISYRKPGRAKTDENKYKMKYGANEREKKQHLVRETRTPMGMVSTTKFDKYGNTLESVVKEKGGSGFIKSTVGYGTGDMDTAGNYAVTQTDALGKASTSKVGKDNGLLHWKKDPAGTQINYEYDYLKRLKNLKCTPEAGKTYRNDFAYDDSGRLTTVSHNTTGAISDVSYAFEYDVLGAQTEVKVAGHTLSRNVYNQTDRSHRLEEVVFGNGGRQRNSYDEFDRVIGISYDDAIPATNPRYRHTFGASGQTAYVTDTHLGRTQWAEYDQAGRPMQFTTWDGVFDSENTVERGKLMYRTTLKYDKYNHLALFGERVPGKDQARPIQKKDSKGNLVYENGQPVYEKDLNGNIKYEPADDDGTDNITTKYEYDRDDRVTKITYDEKAEERSLQYTYDKLGRVKQVMVQNGGAVYEIDEDENTDTDTTGYTGDVNIVSYQYADGGQGANSASSRVTRIVHSGLNTQLDYAYDELGNIVSESCDLDGNTNQYRYDKMGQLIRASVRNDTTCGANGTTWVYTYDLGGNILKKEGYPKLTDIDNELPASPTKVINYTYDAEWKDLLTSYDGKPIQYTPDTLPQMPEGMTYFHMGNPYKYDGWTYEWQAGRQLKSMTHKNEQGVQDKKLEFVYTAVGLRTQKKYTYTNEQGQTVVETTDYILHGKLLTHQKTTTTVNGIQQGEPYQLHFYYDKDSRPSMVRVGNEEAQSKYYSYVFSFQGDVLGLVDRNQDLMVKYVHTPWGKVLEERSLTTECDKLAELNPFRYRGYVYDSETGFYLAATRYYDSTIGRFINADTVDSLDYANAEGNPLGCNLYAYCFNNPANLTDESGEWPSWAGALLKIAAGAVIIAGLAVATVATGGAAAVICGAALSGAIAGGASGAVLGAVGGVISGGGWQGALDGAANGFLTGTIIGGVTGAASAGINIASGSTQIVGNAHGSVLHKLSTNMQAGKMAASGQYSQIGLNKSLKTMGMKGTMRPDVIGVGKNGVNKIVEVISPKQSAAYISGKMGGMLTNNPGSTGKIVQWVGYTGKLLR